MVRFNEHFRKSICMKAFSLATVLLVAGFAPAMSDDASIESVSAKQAGDTWTFSVTLLHGDTGWDDYADGWRVVLEDGTEIGMRVLYHPHVDEQPFTRSQSGIKIPDGTKTVFVEARTNTDGWGAARYTVDVTN